MAVRYADDMRTPVPFDTHDYVKQLTAAGVPEPQAEVHARALANLVNDQIATKRDLEELRIALKHDLDELRIATQHDIEGLRIATQHDIEGLRIAFKHDIEELRIAFKHDLEEQEMRLGHEMEKHRLGTQRDLKDLELRLTIRIGVIVAAAVGVIAGIVKLL
jgi:hypothetical protein